MKKGRLISPRVLWRREAEGLKLEEARFEASKKWTEVDRGGDRRDIERRIGGKGDIRIVLRQEREDRNATKPNCQ